MSKILVMIIEGKNDSEDYVTLKGFVDYKAANDFIESINIDTNKKYWKTASIVPLDQKFEIAADFNPHFM